MHHYKVVFLLYDATMNNIETSSWSSQQAIRRALQDYWACFISLLLRATQQPNSRRKYCFKSGQQTVSVLPRICGKTRKIRSAKTQFCRDSEEMRIRKSRSMNYWVRQYWQCLTQDARRSSKRQCLRLLSSQLVERGGRKKRMTLSVLRKIALFSEFFPRLERKERYQEKADLSVAVPAEKPALKNAEIQHNISAELKYSRLNHSFQLRLRCKIAFHYPFDEGNAFKPLLQATRLNAQY